jgi:hypothetical protein
VIPEKANVREQPNAQARVVTSVGKGVAVKQIEAKGDWTKVQVGDKTGWILSRLLRGPSQPHPDVSPHAQNASPSAEPAAISYRFANLEWGADEETVKLILTKNYTFVEKEADGDLRFDGEILSEKVTILAYMSEGKLVRVVLRVNPHSDDLRATYKRFKTSLIERYGKPVRDDEFYNRPYYKGDGYEESAIRLGKGALITEWKKHSDGTKLSMFAFRSDSIQIGYDTPAGAAEEKKRSSVTKSDL